MKDLKKYYIIPAEPEVVYAALTKEATIRLWTGAPVKMPTEPGEEFSMWDDDVIGKLLELEEGKRIVQQWYFGDQEEPSIVTFKFHDHKKGCSLEVQQTHIPDEAFEEMTEGWDDVFIASLIDFYTEH